MMAAIAERHQHERALAHAPQRAIEMRPPSWPRTQEIEMPNEGPSDRAEMLWIGIPTVLLGLLAMALALSSCERAAPPRITEPVPVVAPIDPDEALDKSEAWATKRVNEGLIQADMSHGFPRAIAKRLATTFRAKAWIIEEQPIRDGTVWLTFSWPEVKP